MTCRRREKRERRAEARNEISPLLPPRIPYGIRVSGPNCADRADEGEVTCLGSGSSLERKFGPASPPALQTNARPPSGDSGKPGQVTRESVLSTYHKNTGMRDVEHIWRGGERWALKNKPGSHRVRLPFIFETDAQKCTHGYLGLRRVTDSAKEWKKRPPCYGSVTVAGTVATLHALAEPIVGTVLFSWWPASTFD